MTSSPRSALMRRPPRRDWPGAWAPCPFCHRTMAMVVENGRQVYECTECVDTYGEAQLELFVGASA